MALWTADRIVVAVDSKSIWSDRRGERIEQRCKIRQTDGFWYAVAGFDAETGTRFAVRSIAEQAARFPGAITQKVAEFGRLIETPLRRALENIRATTPPVYEDTISNKGGHALDIVFFGIENGTFFLFVRRFGTRDFRNENHDAIFPSSGQVFMGEHEAINRFVLANPRWKEMGLVPAALKLLELQIQATPNTVGPPVNILVVDRNGPRWAFQPQGCPEIGHP